jgi:hypothetical protein
VTQVDEGPESPGAPGVLTFGVPTAGEILADRYQLQEHINDDSFGRQVWRGIDVVLRRPVAVVLRYPGGDAAVEMLDAAVAASRVVHPHLVDVYDAIDEGTRAYVVREWVDGGSLREYVSEAPLEPDRATSVAAAVASAIAAIHATGMAHGNVHPGTVLIGSDGRVVLSDARADEAATPDADVRAVGAILYCALTGHWPHAEAGPTVLPDAVRDPGGTLATPRQVRGGVPGHLSDLATDLLDPAVAQPSADVLAAELARLDTERDDEFFSGGGPLSFEQPSYGDPAAPEQRKPIGKKLAVGVAVLVVLALAGLLLVTKVFSNSSTGNAATVPGSVTGSASSTKPAVGKPAAIPLTADQVRIVDPPQGTRSEINGAGAVVDGNPSTVWKTEHYHTSANFGDKKPGMGILINFGKTVTVATVRITFIAPGATVELRGGDTDPGNNSAGDGQIVNSYKTIADPQVAQSTIVLNGNGTASQYLLVYVTKLPESSDSPGQYQVGIEDIAVTGA